MAERVSASCLARASLGLQCQGRTPRQKASTVGKGVNSDEGCRFQTAACTGKRTCRNASSACAQVALQAAAALQLPVVPEGAAASQLQGAEGIGRA